MDGSSQFVVPTIIDVPELIVTNEDLDFDDNVGFTSSLIGGGAGGAPSSARRAYWANKLQFLSSALCYTIGLGNVWRFPHLCYKHAGGAYLAAYTLVLLLVGAPLLLMELAFGQYANEGPITIWRISPAFEGLGYAMCLTSCLVALYFGLINTWSLRYLLATLSLGPLPWTSCDNYWNSAHCFYKPEENFDQRAGGDDQRNLTSNCSAQMAASSGAVPSGAVQNRLSVQGCGQSQFQFETILNSSNEVQLPANEFFHEAVLGLTSRAALLEGGALLGHWNWTLVGGALLLWLLVFSLLLKSLRPTLSSLTLALSAGAASEWLALASLLMPFLSLFALLVRALTLAGANQGVALYLTPQWARLQNVDIWCDAVTQLFYSLAPCWGGIIALANTNKFHNNFHSNTALLVALNYLVSLTSGLAAFATLGFMSAYSGVRIDQVADAGPGLIFQVFPETLAQMPLSRLSAPVFFATLLAVGLANQLTLIETVITAIVDAWPHKLRYRRPLLLVVLCGALLLLSLPLCLGNGFYLLQVLDAFAGTLTGMLIGLLELLAIAWVYGMENFMQDIDDMLSVHRPLLPSRAYWHFMWRYLTPSCLFAVLLFSLIDFPPLAYRDVAPLPSWLPQLGWLLSGLCAALVPLVALWRLLQAPGSSLAAKLAHLCRPSEDWAPSSYISGPKLMNRHQMFGGGGGGGAGPPGGAANARDTGYSECSISQTGDDESAGGGGGGIIYTSKRAHRRDYRDQDLISNCDDDEQDEQDEQDGQDDQIEDDQRDHVHRPRAAADSKVAKASSYIIPEEEEEDEQDEQDEDEQAGLGLITSETSV